MRYADVSDANLYYGNMRFDVNVSVSKTDTLGTRTETKNLNSFRSVERAVEYEVERQIGIIEDGGEIVQETRGWDDDKQVTFSQRSKEDAHDYRYMPDPDLPPVILSEDYVQTVEAAMPALPAAYRSKFSQMGIDSATIEDIIADPVLAMRIGRIYDVAGAEHAKRIAFWLMRPASDDNVEVSKQSQGDESIDDQSLVKLSQMVTDNKLSSTAAKEVLDEMLLSGNDPEAIAEAKNLLQVSDEGAILEVVKQVLAENQKAADDVRNGEMKAIGFLVGQVMKLSQGKANPGMATELIKKQLGL